MGVKSSGIHGCFLIGSGPSLNKVDVKRLSRLDTIAFNRSYVAWPRWGFAPTYYACTDPCSLEVTIEELKRLIVELPETRFFLNESAASYGLGPSEQVMLVRPVKGNVFAGEISQPTDFGNVGATSIQILALLGYRRIAMVGVDASYAPLRAEAVVGSEFIQVDDDPNHFCPEYLKGRRVRANLSMVEVLGRWADVALECRRHGVDVKNASPGSALDCFPVSTFEETLDWITRA